MPVNQVKRNGSYAPLSARYYQDDAVALAGPMAELLYVRALAFCASQLSDGFISDVQLAKFVSVGISSPKRHAARLCEVGLWERVEHDLLGAGCGYRVVSWLKHNASRAEIEAKQRKDAERMARARKAAQ